MLKKRLGLFMNNTEQTSILRDIIWASEDFENENYTKKRIVYITDHDRPVDYSAFDSNNPELVEKWKYATMSSRQMIFE